MSEELISITEDNLSVAWAKAFQEVMAPGVSEIGPMVVTVTGFADGSVVESADIREALDRALAEQGTGPSCQTTARLIFPNSLWNPARPRDLLYDRYKAILPLIRRCPPNRYGIYFERMVAFGPDKINQLEHIIQTYLSGNHRRSALQLAIFDPASDHSNARQRGFPCLQQIALVPVRGEELHVSGFYPMQHIFKRAYGNYLGLCWLGLFVAKELGLRLTKMRCFADVAELGKPARKTDLRPLARTVKDFLES